MNEAHDFSNMVVDLVARGKLVIEFRRREKLFRADEMLVDQGTMIDATVVGDYGVRTSSQIFVLDREVKAAERNSVIMDALLQALARVDRALP